MVNTNTNNCEQISLWPEISLACKTFDFIVQYVVIFKTVNTFELQQNKQTQKLLIIRGYSDIY